GVPQQSCVFPGGKLGHPAVPERGLEVVLEATAHLMHLVHEQHAETVTPNRCRVYAWPRRPGSGLLSSVLLFTGQEFADGPPQCAGWPRRRSRHDLDATAATR